MAKFGVIPADVKAGPAPVVVRKFNFDELCTLHDTITDQEGDVIRCNGHTPPLMYLATEQYSADTRTNYKSKFDDYVGFMVYTVFHPDKGEIVITHGIPREGPTDVSRYIGTLSPGNVFMIASFETGGGNRLFKPVPTA